MSDTQADGYYDEPELNSEELDLSFLDDEEDTSEVDDIDLKNDRKEDTKN